MKIVCLTSNAYHNVLVPFAHYWNRFGFRQVTVACYDAPLPDLPDNFEVLRIGNQADYTWSSGLKRALTLVDDAHVMLLLEDYFLTAPADWFVIGLAAGALQNNRNIAKFDLSDDRMKYGHHPDGSALGVILSDWDAPFQTSLQAAIWRTDFLYRWLDDSENAWQFEKDGTRRIINARRRGICTDIIAGFREPPLVYANAVGGAGGKPGVIERKHMPEWMFDECVAKGWADNG